MKALKILSKAIIVVIIVMLVGTILTNEARNFNNGVCVECGINYEAVDTTRHGQVVYVCPNCHHKAYN